MTYLLIFIIATLILYIFVQKSKSSKKTRDESLPEIILQMPTPEAPIDKDAWEEWDTAHYGPGQRVRELNGVRLQIQFVDRNGAETERPITLKRYAYNPETNAGVLHAWCHLRNANRPFALQRINKAVDLDTGEIIPQLGRHLDALYEQTPAYAVEQFLAQHEAGALVLFAFAKADGAMRAKERAVILGWAAQQGLTDQPALTELESQMKGWSITKHGYWEAVKTVRNIPRTEAYVQSLWSAVTAIVLSDKKPSEQEVQFMRYAAKQWGIPEKEVPALLEPNN